MRDPIPDFSDFVELPEPWADLEAGNLHAALNGFATRHLLDIRHHPGNRAHADNYLIDFGVALWLMGDCYGAANIWSHVCDQAYRGRFDYSCSGTFGGGLLLWFASVWLKDEEWHDEAAQLLDKLLRKKYPVMGATYPEFMANSCAEKSICRRFKPRTATRLKFGRKKSGRPSSTPVSAPTKMVTLKRLARFGHKQRTEKAPK